MNFSLPTETSSGGFMSPLDQKYCVVFEHCHANVIIIVYLKGFYFVFVLGMEESLEFKKIEWTNQQ